MGLSDLLKAGGGLEKLRITTFEDNNYAKATKSFLVMYNPTTFSETRNSQWLPEKNVNTNSKEKTFRGNKSDKVTFEFLFDATGASPSSENKAGIGTSTNKDLVKNLEAIDVWALIKASSDDPSQRHVNGAISKFFEITQTVVGDIHTPNYIQINWGAYEFRGILDSATINYKLFNSSGLPIRATLSANFSESISKKEEAATQKTKSPDLTHYRILKEGDTLPLLSQMMYGDPSYYMELAKINGLTNFRNIKVGQRIIFPPIDKSNKSK
jgi:hypothetical protein